MCVCVCVHACNDRIFIVVIVTWLPQLAGKYTFGHTCDPEMIIYKLLLPFGFFSKWWENRFLHGL